MYAERQYVETQISALEQIMFTEQYADKVIERVLSEQPYWDLLKRKTFVTDTYNIIRWWRKLTVALNGDDNKSVLVWSIWGAYQLLSTSKVPDWPEFKSLDIDKLNNNLAQASIAQVNSYPDWLWQKASEELGEQWPLIAQGLNVPAKTYLRANTLKCSLSDLKTSLAQEKIECEHLPSSEALEVTQYGHLFKSQAFSQGWFEMQDAGSQQIAQLLEPKAGQRVVDACAGAGGKSLHIAALMQNKGYVLAMDIHQHKLDTLKKRAKRAGVHMLETREIKNSKTIKRLKNKFDRVLLDVPCSGTGVLRRNPDAKWLLKSENINALVSLQAEILQRYSQMCKPGGRLVYATCSILPSENQQQVQTFLANNTQFKLVEELHLQPGINSDFDGFYGAALERQG
ncbi:Ribosomal RNA small subunit methyltransferase B [Pseudoalteromonas sp. CIP111854]|uniref:Ribosomal RNA small subunit methyltransferase B n=1 Tax=Pseudoalteromonas holothuriae TaxID=2963714 RepID=A0A9W4QUA6_9GAMM|nr:RsmB/NOP family class I SAM-dependent RNA methyltransferase [Pseudoalteromonas sp. CIP111854]CAH9053559.1 Ribosomal RNA small subunit methyltransferase B [Pseudoalteromonas sp. CIP111854]